MKKAQNTMQDTTSEPDLSEEEPSNVNGETSELPDADQYDDYDVNGGGDDDMEENQNEMLEDEPEQEEEVDTTEEMRSPEEAPKKRGRPSKKTTDEATSAVSSQAKKAGRSQKPAVSSRQLTEQVETPEPAPKKARGRPKTAPPEDKAISTPKDAPTKGPGRRKRAETATAADNEAEPQVEVERPAKKQKKSKALSERHPNTQRAKKDQVAEKMLADGNKRFPGRSLVILKRTEAPEDVQRTRSGRATYKPLAHWRNEQVEYEEDEEDSRFPLSKIKHVIRVDEIPEEGRKKAPARKRAKSKKPKEVESESEEEDNAEAWEVDPGVITLPVKAWDAQFEESIDEDVEEGMFKPLDALDLDDSLTVQKSHLLPPPLKLVKSRIQRSDMRRQSHSLSLALAWLIFLLVV